MTSRNLNRTWRDVIFTQYAADYEADVPFPVRYLINIPIVYGMPGRDIFIQIPVKIEVQTLRKAVIDFYIATRQSGDPTYQNEHISVHPRKLARELEGATKSGGKLNGGDGEIGVGEVGNEDGDGGTAAF